MRETIYDMWNSVMNADHNPLKNIPSLQTRHMILQILAWTWRVVLHLHMVVCGYGVFNDCTLVYHRSIVVTVATFETAKKTTSV